MKRIPQSFEESQKPELLLLHVRGFHEEPVEGISIEPPWICLMNEMRNNKRRETEGKGVCDSLYLWSHNEFQDWNGMVPQLNETFAFLNSFQEKRRQTGQQDVTKRRLALHVSREVEFTESRKKQRKKQAKTKTTRLTLNT